MSVLTRTMEESLQGIRVVKAFGAKAYEMAKFDAAANDALRLANHRIRLRIGSITSMTFAFYVAMGLVLWVGGHRVQAGTMTIGQLTEFLAFMTILQLPVRQIIMIVNSSARATSSGARLFEVLDLKPTIGDKIGASDLTLGAGALRFENVCFNYGASEDRVPALSGISFEVRAGETLGVIGAPGSGKTTLAQLIPRFYDVSGGRIAIDGQDVRDVTLASLRQAVGLVAQDVFLFDTSIADNIGYAEPGASRRRLEHASATAELHEHVSGLPLGYETFIGERGVTLSGGQRQRLSIARGILPSPSILVFDDTTSAVDTATEHRIRTALRAATHNRTTIIIAHRISSIMHADEIIVLDEGRIAERGTHFELIAKNGIYAELYRLQSRSEPAVAAADFYPISEAS